MTPDLLHICRSGVAHHGYFWTFMAGSAAGCFLHCASICALCAAGGTALGARLLRSFRETMRHASLPLMMFNITLFLSFAGDLI